MSAKDADTTLDNAAHGGCPATTCYASSCGRVTLYLGDSLAIAPTLKGVDALISDPPYGISYFHSGGGGGSSTLEGGDPATARAKAYAGAGAMIIGDDKPFDPTPWLQYPAVILWGGNHFSDRLPKNPKWLIWDKIVVPETYGKFSFADCEMAWTNQKGTARIYKQLWQGCRREGESNADGKLHPNQKPVMLMQWCMEQAKLPESCTVLDPYMGSGSTIIAAIRTGRRAIGIELDPAHYANAVQRITNELAQGDLFLGHKSASDGSRRYRHSAEGNDFMIPETFETPPQADCHPRLVHPLTDHGGIAIYLGDCLDIMPQLENDTFDAVVTDPPYSSGGRTQAAARNVVSKSKSREADEWFIGDNMGVDTYIRWMRQIARESLRVVIQGGHAYVFTDWRQFTNLSTAWESIGWSLRSVIVWDKAKGGAMGSFWRNNHEWCCVFTKGQPNPPAHRSCFNTWTGSKPQGHEHPTEKPLGLMTYIIGAIPKSTGKILEPFAGSGTTLEAAKLCGFGAVGIERNPVYAKACAAKISQGTIAL